MMQLSHILKGVSLLLLASDAHAFTGFKLPNIFGGGKPAVGVSNVENQKKAILEAASFTNNGKTATEEQQAQTLKLVRELEKTNPPSEKLLSDPNESLQLDGTWYLQYTSPSEVGDPDQFPDSWKPVYADEGQSKITTTKFEAKGSVSAAGIKVETANRVVKQTFDVEKSTVLNDIELDWGRVLVGGPFRQSSKVPNRAVVSFQIAKIMLNAGPTFDLGFVFSILAIIRGTSENGWLETTFIDKDMRIGRGNKGTMFILTRDVDAVKP